MNKLWELEHGYGRYWYSAHSNERVLQMYLDYYRSPTTGEVVESSLPDSISKINIHEILDDTEISVRSEIDDSLITKTAAQWAADGEGLIAMDAF